MSHSVPPSPAQRKGSITGGIPSPSRRWGLGAAPAAAAALKNRFVVSKQDVAPALIKRGPCGFELFDPRESSFLVYWDIVTLLALVYTAFVTPYEISFITDFSLLLFVFNRIIDVIFISDMIVSFSTMIPPSKSMALSGGTQWQTRSSAIAFHYLTGWFTVDFVSVAVSAGDIVQASMSPSDASEGFLMLVQLLRVIRLLKMARLLRGFRMWKRWETRHAVNYSMLKLTSCLGTILVSSHWIACLWSLQTLFKSQRHESWLGRGNLPYCQADEATGGTVCVHPWEVWAASMHFSVMTITSIGYGDIYPTDASEQLVGLVIMLASGILWASTIGTLCAVLTESPEVAQFHTDLDSLNTYMDENGVALPLRQQLREFFHEAVALRRNKSTQALLTQMPPALLAKLVLQTNGHWLNRIQLLTATDVTTDLSQLEDLDPSTSSHRFFLVEVMLSLVSVVYSPKETVSDGYLSVITNGLAFVGMSIGGTGTSFGDDALLSAKHLRKHTSVVAINYLSVYMIEPDAIRAIARKYPLFGRVLRRRVLLLALRRFMSYLVAEARAVSEKAAGGSGSKLIDTLRRLQSRTTEAVTPPNHAYRAQQMLDPVIYETVCAMASEQSQMRQDLRTIIRRLDDRDAAHPAPPPHAPPATPVQPTPSLAVRDPTPANFSAPASFRSLFGGAAPAAPDVKGGRLPSTPEAPGEMDA